MLLCSGKWGGIVASFEGGAPRTARYRGTLLPCIASLFMLSISWSRREPLQHVRLKGKSICGETLQYLKIDSQSHRLLLFCKNKVVYRLERSRGAAYLSSRISIPRVLNHVCI